MDLKISEISLLGAPPNCSFDPVMWHFFIALTVHELALARNRGKSNVAALDQLHDKRLALARRSLGTYVTGIGDAIRRLRGGEYTKYLAPLHAYLDEIPGWRQIVPA
jgi:hypothetical protein